VYGLVLIKAYCHGTKAKTVELSYISYDNNGFCSIHIILASLRPEGLIRGYEVEARRVRNERSTIRPPSTHSFIW
jgi:hypothetical protein